MKVLLYSGIPPGEGGVGEIILNDLCQSMGEEQIQCFAALPRGFDRTKLQGNRYLLGTEERRFETAYRPLKGIMGDLISNLAYRMKFLKCANQIADAAVKAGRAFNPNVLWAVLSTPTVIASARNVAQRLNIPLHVLVWDAPELIARQLGHSSQTTKLIMKSFRDCLQNADRVAVVGESMQEAYRKQYGVESIIVRHGLLKNEQKKTASTDKTNDDGILIGYAGSITAKGTFQNLMNSLASCDWKINGKQVTLRLIGVRYLLEPKGPQRIEYHGWQPVEKTVALLSECDLLYLPQPFDLQNRDLAELSFPTKLTTYLAAQKPVLIHAPEYASVISFYHRYPFGIWHNVLDSKTLISEITSFLNNPAAIESAIDFGDKAVGEELNADVFLQRFRDFISLDSMAVTHQKKVAESH